MRAYDDVIRETSTQWAPKYVVPADRNWAHNVLVARIIVDALRRIDPQLPPPEPGLSELTID